MRQLFKNMVSDTSNVIAVIVSVITAIASHVLCIAVVEPSNVPRTSCIFSVRPMDVQVMSIPGIRSSMRKPDLVKMLN